MSYRAEFSPFAIAQLQGLPSAAFSAALKRVIELTEAPWDGVRIAAPGTDPADREALFDSNRGFLSIRVDDNAEMVRVLRVVWA